MDIFITVVSWIIGLYVAFILLLAIGFAAGGASNTGSSELSIISIASSLLLIYLIWMGVSSLFFSDEADAPDINSSISAGKVKEVYYDTTEIDVSGVTAPSIDGKSTSVQTKAEPRSHTQTATVKEEKSFFDDYQYLLWSFYALAFILYASWLLKPSKVKGRGKDLVKKKLIASMTLKEDATGLKPWNPNWKPEDGDASKPDK